MTPQEQDAVRVLRRRALNTNLFGKPWATAASFPDIVDCEGGYRSSAQHKIALTAPIEKVQQVLSKVLKPGRALVSAVRFTSGQIEEVVAVPPVPEEKKEEPKPEKGAIEKIKDAAAAVATTVAAPVRGCPQPEFAKVEIKATRVLSAFLSADQRADFESKNRFVAVGADTGHRYLVTSRHALWSGVHHGDHSSFRGQLYDLEEQRVYCVHDWDVPAPEEMLGILIHLALPGREKYLRELPPVPHPVH